MSHELDLYGRSGSENLEASHNSVLLSRRRTHPHHRHKKHKKLTKSTPPATPKASTTGTEKKPHAATGATVPQARRPTGYATMGRTARREELGSSVLLSRREAKGGVIVRSHKKRKPKSPPPTPKVKAPTAGTATAAEKKPKAVTGA